MNNNTNPHEIQKHILKVLLNTQSARFADLQPNGVTSDHFNFHIKRLQLLGIIEKTESHDYVLSIEGKEYANRFDIDSDVMTFEKQAKIGVIVKAMKDENGERKYLIQQRLKQPFFGFHGCPGGKIKYGETTYDAAARELLEEAGLTADFELVLIEHRKDVNPDGLTLEDKYFYVFKATNTQGELIDQFESGKNMWLTRKEIEQLKDRFVGLEEGLDIVDNFPGGNPLFIERVNVVEKY